MDGNCVVVHHPPELEVAQDMFAGAASLAVKAVHDHKKKISCPRGDKEDITGLLKWFEVRVVGVSRGAQLRPPVALAWLEIDGKLDYLAITLAELRAARDRTALRLRGP
ncbi:hypothetical protein EVAR_23005_1 [Eumeta japonica]|uniref:Uncharacterized protein n=1 Tax=Eumeta variegata TaxID=151549 RepID=A0A4C1UQP1_EUMVA|nr:hypothetical protein EVAR_23005_1 [Eumeta japonica]